MAELGFGPSSCDIQGALCFTASLADDLGVWEGEMVFALGVWCWGAGKRVGEGWELWKDCGEGVLSLEAFSVISNANHSDKRSDCVCWGKTWSLLVAGVLHPAEELTTSLRC